MMIFHAGSGTILDAKECVLTLKDPEDDDFDLDEDTIDFVEAIALLMQPDEKESTDG